jgi:hypothetical protein
MTKTGLLSPSCQNPSIPWKLRNEILEIKTSRVTQLPWSSTTLNHKIPSHLRALYTHLLEILTFHYTRTQFWNQAHNRRRLSPFQHRLILSQKCWRSGEKLGKFLARSSTSIRDYVGWSIGPLVGWSLRPYVPTMKFCEICLCGKLVMSQLLREEEKEEEIS